MGLFFGRKQAYTATGIRRVPCSRCGAASKYQWQACANGNYHVAICPNCDIELNRLALGFMRIPNAEKLLENYIRRIKGEPTKL